MDNLKNKFKNIETIGRSALVDILDTDIIIDLKEPNDLFSNDKIALLFFLNHSFYRGRSDVLSKTYFQTTVKELNNLWEENKSVFDFINCYNSDKSCSEYLIKYCEDNKHKSATLISNSNYTGFINDFGFHQLIKNIITQPQDTQTVNNYKDLYMILGVLYFIKEKNIKNIVKYSLDKIRAGDVDKIHEELDSIYAIGDKLACFFLRNLVILFKDEINENLYSDKYLYLLPIDTWIKKVYFKLTHPEISTNELKKLLADISVKTTVELKNDMIKRCKDYEINPLFFNQGCWFVGFNSLNILLKHIDKIN